MKVTVNKDACIGCGACTAIASEIFEMDDDGLAIATMDKVPEELEDDAHEAVESCPTSAIIEE